MARAMGYERLWIMRGHFWCKIKIWFPKKVWVMRGYGLWVVWVKRYIQIEWPLHQNSTRLDGAEILFLSYYPGPSEQYQFHSQRFENRATFNWKSRIAEKKSLTTKSYMLNTTQRLILRHTIEESNLSTTQVIRCWFWLWVLTYNFRKH